MQTEVLRGGGYWYVGDKSPVLEEFRNEMQIYERMSYMTMLRSEAFRDMPAALWRFESAAVTTPQLAKARGYAQNWDEFKKAGIGLLLFGNVGTGKSYAAGCIANALIDRLESVLFVGVSDVVNRMQGNFGADRDSYMTSLMRPELLILDDLGAERNTSFGKERVFDVDQPQAADWQAYDHHHEYPNRHDAKAASLDERRIYDRILEVCVPIRFDGDSFRKSTAADNLKTWRLVCSADKPKKGAFTWKNCIGTVPIHLKMTLTAREAAEYSNIGINKIDSMLRTPNCPFVLFVGTKKLVKRREFEQYISRKMAI
ncbi:MAG: excisionase [Oscillospiraceae bacterium]